MEEELLNGAPIPDSSGYEEFLQYGQRKDHLGNTFNNVTEFQDGSLVGEEYDEFNEYDAGLTYGQDQNINRADNTNYKVLRSLARLPREIVGEAANTVGYLAAGIGAITGTNDDQEWDGKYNIIADAFLDFGEAAKDEEGRAIALYTNESGVFQPGNADWWAKTITNFGPTLGMMAASMGTSGLLSGGTNILGKAGSVAGKALNTAGKQATKAYATGVATMAAGRAGAVKGASLAAQRELYDQVYKRAINKFAKESVESAITKGSLDRMGRFSKAMTSAAISRNAESLGAAEQLYQDTYETQKSLHPEYSEEKLKEVAGEAAANLYKRSMQLVMLDFFQYDEVYKALGLKSLFSSKVKKGILSKLSSALAEPLSEGVEEGLQFTFEQQEKDRLYTYAGDKGTLKTFFDSMDEKEFKEAFIQGAIGGGVFKGAGYLYRKAFQKELNRDAEDFEKLVEEAKVATPSGDEAITIIKNPNKTKNPDLDGVSPDELSDNDINADDLADIDSIADQADALADDLEEPNDVILGAEELDLDTDIIDEIANELNTQAEAIHDSASELSELDDQLEDELSPVIGNTPQETFENLKTQKVEISNTNLAELSSKASKLPQYKGKNLQLLFSDVVDNILADKKVKLTGEQKAKLKSNYSVTREEGDRKAKFHETSSYFKKIKKELLTELAADSADYTPDNTPTTVEERLDALPAAEVAEMTKATESEELKELGIKALRKKALADYKEYANNSKNPSDKGFRKSKYYESTKQLNKVVNDVPLSESLQELSNNNPLADSVVQLAEEIGKDVEIEFVNQPDDLFLFDNSGDAYYDADTNKVIINKSSLNPQIDFIKAILLHSIHQGKGNKNSYSYKRLKAIHKHLKKNLPSTNSNFNNFLEEVLTNPEYANKLANYEIPKDSELQVVNNKFTQILQEIIQNILNMFGVKAEAYDQVIQNLTVLINESTVNKPIIETPETTSKTISAKTMNIVTPYQFENGKVVLDSNDMPVIKTQFKRILDNGKPNPKWNGVNYDKLKMGFSPKQVLTFKMTSESIPNYEKDLVHLIDEDGDIVGILPAYNPAWGEQPKALQTLRNKIWKARSNNEKLSTYVSNITNNDILSTNKQHTYDTLTPEEPVIGIWNMAAEGMKDQVGDEIQLGTPIVTTTEGEHIVVGEEGFEGSRFPTHLGHPVIIVSDNSGKKRLIPGDAKKFNENPELELELLAAINNAKDKEMVQQIQEVVRWGEIPEGRDRIDYFPKIRSGMRREYSDTKVINSKGIQNGEPGTVVADYNPAEHKQFLAGKISWKELKDSPNTKFYRIKSNEEGLFGDSLIKDTLEPQGETQIPNTVFVHPSSRIYNYLELGKRFAQVNRDRLQEPNYLQSVKNRFGFKLSPLNIFRIPDYSINLLSDETKPVKSIPTPDVIMEQQKPSFQPAVEETLQVQDEVVDQEMADAMDFLTQDLPDRETETQTICTNEKEL